MFIFANYTITMARNRKKRKPRKVRKSYRKEYLATDLDFQNDLGELIVKTIKEDLKELETAFGPIKLSDGAVVYQLKNKGAFLPITSIGEKNPDDYLEILLEYERLNIEFPEEPFIHVQIADCLKDLNREEKYRQRLHENFLNFKGYPLVDIEYAMNLEPMSRDQYESIFSEELNIHDAYPGFKAFDDYTVIQFYALKAKYYIALEEYETARNCIDIVEQLDVNNSRLLTVMLSYASDPSFRRKAILTRSVFLVVLLGIVGGVIWGVIRFFQWIF